MKICKMGVWDDSIPGINFDSEGVSNYAKIQLALMESYPRGVNGEKDLYSVPPLFLEYIFKGSHILDNTSMDVLILNC